MLKNVNCFRDPGLKPPAPYYGPRQPDATTQQYNAQKTGSSAGIGNPPQTDAGKELLAIALQTNQASILWLRVACVWTVRF